MTPPFSLVPPHRPGGPSRVIQGFFPGGHPRLARPVAVSPPQAPPAARPAAVPGRPKPVRPATGPRPILPAATRPVAVQPSGGDAFALPAGFQLRPSALGQRLPEAVQQKMEAFFGARFDDVRVHVGNEAASIGALAFTIGSDLYFAPGQYSPQTMQGQQLLGHELTHVVQQRAGRVRNPLGSGMAVVQDPALEAEAERMGMRAATARPPIQAKTAGPSPVGARPAGAPIAPGPAGAAHPARLAAGGPPPILPKPAAVVSPAQARTVGDAGAVPVRVSPPAKVGPNSYRIVAGAGGQSMGSVMVHKRGDSTIEVTNLEVESPHRRQGLGEVLLQSALQAGARMGRSTAVLASQDDGSGRLTRWYQRLGFSRAGVNERGYARFEAPTGRPLARIAQARMDRRPGAPATSPGGLTPPLPILPQAPPPAIRPSQGVAPSGRPTPSPNLPARPGVVQRMEMQQTEPKFTKGEVRFLLREMVVAAWWTYAFHATRSRHVPSILAQGLDPVHGGTGAAKGNETFEEHSKGHVHYARRWGLAHDYKGYFEGGSQFAPKKVDNPEPAEILLITLPTEWRDLEEVDPDSKGYDQAYRSEQLIASHQIKPLGPMPLPPRNMTGDSPKKEKKKKKKKQEKEKEKEQEKDDPQIIWSAFKDEVLRKGTIENNILFSNLSKGARALIEEVATRGGELNKYSILTMLKNALRSMRVEDLFTWNELDALRKEVGGVRPGASDALLGLPLSFEHERELNKLYKGDSKEF